MEVTVTRFSKVDMFNELRTIFLFEADHVLMGAGSEAAAAFIGFTVPDDGEYCHLPPEKVDLKRFQISGAFDRGYEFAFRPSVMNTLVEGEVQDLNVFMLGTPRAGGIDSGGETDRFMTSEGLCQMVADTVYARWRLERESLGAHTFTTRDLALLADMTEGGVRNALADKSEGGLRAIPGKKNPVIVEHAEALRWLKGRRGFVPSPSRASDDLFLSEQLQATQTAEGLGRIIGRRLWDSFGSPSKAAEALSWSLHDIETWQKGRQVFDMKQALQLAKAIDVDGPLFAGKALELTLRRDFSNTLGV
jgi:hypothetical protein